MENPQNLLDNLSAAATQAGVAREKSQNLKEVRRRNGGGCYPARDPGGCVMVVIGWLLFWLVVSIIS